MSQPIFIQDIQISTRTKTILLRSGYKTLQQVSHAGPLELGKCRNCGKRTLEEIYALLEKYNLTTDWNQAVINQMPKPRFIGRCHHCGKSIYSDKADIACKALVIHNDVVAEKFFCNSDHAETAQAESVEKYQNMIEKVKTSPKRKVL